MLMISCGRLIAIMSEGIKMFSEFGFLDLGAPELILILLIVLLLFGGTKLPQLSRSLGESMRELRKGLDNDGKTEKQREEKAKQSAS